MSVVVCTRNRADSLRRTLQRMRDLLIPNGIEWELVVVDNGSSDATPQVIDDAAGGFPLRRLHEPAGGLSHARNKAVSEAKGDYIVWTDDDVLVDPGWLAAYVGAFARWPAAVVFGGPVEPEFVGNVPQWLSATLPRIRGAFALVDLGPDPIPLSIDGTRLPFGANYAVRAAEQRQRRYEVRFGRRPDNMGMVGEETDVVQTLLAAGGEGRWVPNALVRHVIPEERQTLGYVRRQLVGYGEFRERRAAIRGMHRPSRTRLWLTMVTHELLFGLRKHVWPATKWMEDVIAASDARGRLLGRKN